MNINFGLFPPLPNGVRRLERKKLIVESAMAKITEFNPF
jgi:folate-dependent tRNA-U54 methylase TrmFO/GidA